MRIIDILQGIGRQMGIFVAIPMTILAFWIISKLYDYTDRNSIKLIIFFGVLIVASILTIIICNTFGLDFYEIDESEIDQRGVGPFRWQAFWPYQLTWHKEYQF